MRNDGKPSKDWAPGVDLKEAVLIGSLAVVVVALVAITVYAVLGHG